MNKNLQNTLVTGPNNFVFIIFNTSDLINDGSHFHYDEYSAWRMSQYA